MRRVEIFQSSNWEAKQGVPGNFLSSRISSKWLTTTPNMANYPSMLVLNWSKFQKAKEKEKRKHLALNKKTVLWNKHTKATKEFTNS